MKKIFVLFLVLMFALPFCGCSKSDDKIRLSEVTHSIFYAPLYVAINNGYFNDEGIDIELTNAGGSDAVMAALLSGSADVGLLGAEANIYVINGESTNKPVLFAQLTKKDGSFLVGRTQDDSFSWDKLQNKEIIGGRRGGMPAMSLQYIAEVKNKQTIGDGTNGTVKINLDIAYNMTTAAFEGGLGDYVTMFEPTATEFQNQGKGYIVASIGEGSGEVPYTCFTSLQNYFKKNQTKLEKFNKAILRGYTFLYSATDEEIYQALKDSFPSTSKESIIASVKSYKKIDAWSSTLITSESAFDNMQDIMINAGELTKKVNFADVVNTSLAQKVYESYSAK